MTQSASFAVPLVVSGVVQMTCGVAVFMMDLIGTVAFRLWSPGPFLNTALGIFIIITIITGSITSATGSSCRSGSSSLRGLSIASLVLSILSILASVGMVWLWGINLTNLTTDVCEVWESFYNNNNNCMSYISHSRRILGADIAIAVVMLVTSVSACFFTSKVMSSIQTVTPVANVTYTAQPDVISGAQQPYGGYHQVPQHGSTGQHAPYPTPYRQQKA